MNEHAPIGDNRLPAIAASVSQAHRTRHESAVEAAARAIDAGRGLIEAKGLVPRGQWAAWLLANVGLSTFAGRRYMRLARLGLGQVAEKGIRASNGRIHDPTSPEFQGLIPFHPLSTPFPLLGPGFLARSVRQHGLRWPILLSPDGSILDGRCRYLACLKTRVEPQFRTFHGDWKAAAEFLVSHNLLHKGVIGTPISYEIMDKLAAMIGCVAEGYFFRPLPAAVEGLPEPA